MQRCAKTQRAFDSHQFSPTQEQQHGSGCAAAAEDKETCCSSYAANKAEGANHWKRSGPATTALWR